MPLSSFVGSFNAGVGAAATTVAVTGTGFTPEVILFWWSGRSESADTIGRASNYRGFGAAASATSRAAICSNSLDAAGTSDTARASSQAQVILSVDIAAAIDGSIDLQSFDADGFTLVVTNQMPLDLRVHYLALGGDSLTNAKVDRFTAAGTAPIDQVVTGVGFQPDFVLFFSATAGLDPPTAGNHSLFSIGAAVSSSAQATLAVGAQNAVTTTITKSYSTAGECYANLAANAATVSERADFVSLDADGFTINWAERLSAYRIFYLALKGGNYAVGNLLTQTDTVTDIVESGLGFRPSAAMFFSNGQTESTSDTVQNHDRVSIGAFSGVTTRGAQGVLDEHNLADSEITTAIELDEVYVNIKTDSTIDGLMDIKGIDGDGFTCIMDDADPAQAFVWYMAFGPGVAGDLTVSVSETITLTENASALLVSPASVSETVTLSESTTENLVSFVAASETITLSEEAAVALADLSASASETITLTEATAENLVSRVSTTETVTLTETLSGLLVSYIPASETVTLSEAVSALLISDIAASETVTLTEALSAVTGDPQVSVTETITLSETASITLTSLSDLALAVDDSITLSEAASVNLVFLLDITESITLAEDVTAEAAGGLQVSLDETITLTESATLLTSIIVTVVGTVMGVRATGTVTGVRATGTIRG